MDWLSASVLTAIVVFVLRELFDLVRRKTSTGRQIEAYKIVLKRQCELNAWAVTKIRETLKTMEASPDDEFKLVQKQFHLRFEHSGGSWPIPNVHLEDMKDAMFAVATLQSDIFDRLERAYEACLDLNRLREHLIEYLAGQAEFYDLEALVDYGLREVNDVAASLDRLYQSCSNGNALGKGTPF